MYKKVCSILFFVLLLVGCTSSDGEEVVGTPLSQVFVFPGEQEKRLISQETIEQDNCDGTANTSQTVERSHTVEYTLELGGGVTVKADGSAGIPGVGQVGVGAEVASHYQVGYGRSDTISRSQTVAAAPKSHIQHTIQQFEIWDTGEVLIVAGDVNQRLPYSFRRDFSIEAVAPANIGCPGEIADTEPPSTNTGSPSDDVVSSAVSQEAIKEKTVTTGGSATQTYTMNLANGEIIVGHADRFKDYSDCVAYLVIGPGDFDFSITSGLWDLWSNVASDRYDSLLDEQGNTLADKYGCTPVKFVRCDSQGCQP